MPDDVQKDAIQSLKPQQHKFVTALMDITSSVNIGQAGVIAGYSDKYAYKLFHRPEIQAAIRAICEQENERLLLQRHRVKRALAERALQERVVYDREGQPMDVNASDANTAAKHFLTVTGDIPSGGVSQHVHVQQNSSPGDSFADAVRAKSSDRLAGSRISGEGDEP